MGAGREVWCTVAVKLERIWQSSLVSRCAGEVVFIKDTRWSAGHPSASTVSCPRLAGGLMDFDCALTVRPTAP